LSKRVSGVTILIASIFLVFVGEKFNTSFRDGGTIGGKGGREANLWKHRYFFRPN